MYIGPIKFNKEKFLIFSYMKIDKRLFGINKFLIN